MGAWNISRLSDDQRLPYLSAELRRLRVDIVGFSETKKPGSGDISMENYTFYLGSGQSNGARCKGVAVAICSQLQSSVDGVTPADERMMLMR